MSRFGFPALSPFKKFIWTEFDRRSKDFGLNYPAEGSKRIRELKGPRNVWTRITSNAIANINGVTYQGMVLRTAGSLRETYGIASDGVVVGVSPAGLKLHSEDRDRLRPGPGVTGVAVSYSGTYGTVKTATVSWKANSIEQLEMLQAFFLTPSVTILVEYGWGNIEEYYPFDISDVGKPPEYGKDRKLINPGSGLAGAWGNRDLIEEKIKKAGGNYDALIGLVTNFSFSMGSDGTYSCTTNVTSVGEVMVALEQGSRITVKPRSVSTGPTSFGEFFDHHTDRILLEANDPRLWTYNSRNITTLRQDDDSDIQKVRPEKQDWSFITWGYLEELINDFYNIVMQQDGGAELSIFQIDSSDVIISGHPNLISTNGDILIIPNSNAPLYSAEKKIADRQDLSIHNITFPSSENNNWSGKLYNLFINIDAIKKALDKEPLISFLNSLLGEIQVAGSSLWQFQVRTRADSEHVLEVVDISYTGTPVERFLSPGASSDPKHASEDDESPGNIPYLFRIDKANSFIKDFQFESDFPAEAVANIVYSRGQRNSNVDGEVNEMVGGDRDLYADVYISTSGDQIRFKGDRLLNKTSPTNETPSENKTRDTEDTIEYDADMYWIIWDHVASVYKRYVYPSVNTVNSNLYKDNNPENNRNNNVLIEVKSNITIDGIAGIRVGDCFAVDSVPKKYRTMGVFQVVDISHDIERVAWTTRIEGQYRVANLRE